MLYISLFFAYLLSMLRQHCFSVRETDILEGGVSHSICGGGGREGRVV